MIQNNTNIQSDEFLTVKEVIDLLKISRQTLWKLTTNQTIPSVKIGNSVRYNKKKLYEAFGVETNQGK